MNLQTRSSSYWDKRAIARLTEAERTSDWHFKEIQLLYDAAEKETVAEVKQIYEAYFRQNKFSTDELEKIVTTGEMEKN